MPIVPSRPMICELAERTSILYPVDISTASDLDLNTLLHAQLNSRVRTNALDMQ
jgi:hypothetical protein